MVSGPILRHWAEKERAARLSEGLQAEELSIISETLVALGVEPHGLPIARSETGWVTLEQIEDHAKSLDEVLLVQDAAVDLAGGEVTTARLKKGVYAIEMGTSPILQSERHHWREWPAVGSEESPSHRLYNTRSIEGAVVRAVARAWGCSLAELEKESSFYTDEVSIEREIGWLDDKPYVEWVNILRRPKPRA